MLRIMLIWALALMACVTNVANAEKITLANGEWAPYLSKGLKHHGYMSHIVTTVFAEEGIEVDYVFLPWKRGFEDTKAGKYQGTLIWGYNKERAKDFLYSDPVARLGTSLFHLKSKAVDWNEPSDLKNFKIGGVIGYAYGVEDLETQGVIKILRISKDEANFRKLASGRIDIVLEDTEVGFGLVSRLGLTDKVTAHVKPLSPRDYSVIFPKKVANAQHLLEAFNKGLKKIKADGRYQKMVEASRRGEYK